MICHKCKTDFNMAIASCGTGYSWDLFKCPSCKQLYAEGLCPKEVTEDKRIIILPYEPIGYNAGQAVNKLYD